MLQTVQRIGPLLDLFSAQRTELGVSQVAEALDVPRSSAHELLASLVDTGLLSAPARGRYRIGWRVVELCEVLRSGFDLRAAAAPVLQALTHRTGETTNLGALDHGQVIHLDKVSAKQMVSVAGLPVGSRVLPHGSAMGKAMLACLPDEEVIRVLGPEPLRPYTDHTLTRIDDVLRQCSEIRETGVAFEDQEVVAEVACLGVAIRDLTGGVAGAISISVPRHRMVKARSEYTQAILAAAETIQRGLIEGGYR